MAGITFALPYSISRRPYRPGAAAMALPEPEGMPKLKSECWSGSFYENSIEDDTRLPRTF